MSIVFTSDSSTALRSATEEVVLRLLCSTMAAASTSVLPWLSNWPESEPRFSSAFEVLELKTLS
jgi:hypothetical protein